MGFQIIHKKEHKMTTLEKMLPLPPGSVCALLAQNLQVAFFFLRRICRQMPPVVFAGHYFPKGGCCPQTWDALLGPRNHIIYDSRAGDEFVTEKMKETRQMCDMRTTQHHHDQTMDKKVYINNLLTHIPVLDLVQLIVDYLAKELAPVGIIMETACVWSTQTTIAKKCALTHLVEQTCRIKKQAIFVSHCISLDSLPLPLLEYTHILLINENLFNGPDGQIIYKEWINGDASLDKGSVTKESFDSLCEFSRREENEFNFGILLEKQVKPQQSKRQLNVQLVDCSMFCAQKDDPLYYGRHY